MDMPPSNGESAQGQRIYTLQEGDTLYALAKRFYGNGQQWTKIADANPGLNPDKMPVGQEIVIPRE
jgi:nucleoid-associated protein YgaU